VCLLLTGFQLDHRTQMVVPNRRWMGLRMTR
jgi:hypothetical protein